ncbi:MAG: hypothetical protein OCD00_06620 [Colwellia sp.]
MRDVNPKYMEQEVFDNSTVSDEDVLRLLVNEINETKGSLDDVISANGGTLYIGIDSEWQRIEGRKANHILCYTAAVYTKDKNETCKERLYIAYTEGEKRSQRLSLEHFLGYIVHQAKKDNMIAVWPKKIVVLCHFLRADIVNFSDFWFNQNKHSVEGLRNTVVSLGLPKSIVKEFNIDGNTDMFFIGENRRVKRKALVLKDLHRKPRLAHVKFIDTLLLSPLTSKSLENLADLIDFPKKPIPEGYSIADMQTFMKEKPKEFEAYALRDAQIALRFGIHMMKTIKQEFDQDGLPTTLGSLGVSLVKKSFTNEKGEVCKKRFRDVFGLYHEKVEYFHHANHSIKHKELLHVDPVVDTFFKLATNAFKGAHNVAYAIGATDNEVTTDLDLTGAYSMGLLDLAEPDYSRQFLSRNVDDFKGHVLGFAYAEIEFPESVRYPTVAFRAGTKGLYFTRKGTDYVTAAEIDLCLRLGASVNILTGCIIPWKNDNRFFEPVISHLRHKRQDFDKKTTENEMYKLIMNSIYGKTGQGLSNANGFNTLTLESKKIPPSDITNPFFASHITGLIRAVLGELLNNLPKDVKLINAITDGFLSTIKIKNPKKIKPHEVDITGSLCQRFQALVHRVDPKAHMLEVKSQSNQLICGKTRLHFTIEPHPKCPEKKDWVLAKGNLSIPREELHDAHSYIAKTYLNRTPDTKMSNSHLISTREQWLTESDLIDYQRDIRLNMDFDFKRQPYNPRMVKTKYGACLSFDTKSWGTVEEGRIAREIFDVWRVNDCMTTVEKFEDFEDYYQLQLTKKHTSLRRQKFENCGDIFIRLFLIAYKQELYGLTHDGTDKKLAQWLTDNGFPRKATNFTYAKKAEMPLHCLPYTKKVMTAVRLILSRFTKLSLTPFFKPEALDKVLADLSYKC